MWLAIHWMAAMPGFQSVWAVPLATPTALAARRRARLFSVAGVKDARGIGRGVLPQRSRFDARGLMRVTKDDISPIDEIKIAADGAAVVWRCCAAALRNGSGRMHRLADAGCQRARRVPGRHALVAMRIGQASADTIHANVLMLMLMLMAGLLTHPLDRAGEDGLVRVKASCLGGWRTRPRTGHQRHRRPVRHGHCLGVVRA